MMRLPFWTIFALVISACAALAPILAAGPAAAVTPTCFPREVLAAALAKVGQAQRVIGMDDYGGVMELFADPAGKWTIIANLANGQSCIYATGFTLEIAPPEASPPQGIDG